MRTRRHPSRLALLPVLLLTATALLAVDAGAAAAAPVWEPTSQSNTTVEPHGHVEVTTVADGSASPAVNEVQRLDIGAAGGQYRLTFGADTSGDIAYNASAAVVQSALEALPSIGAGNVAVAPGAAPFGTEPPYLVTFEGALAAANVSQITASDGTQPLAGALTYYVSFRNTGNQGASGPIEVDVTLPPGMTGVSADNTYFGGMECPGVAGATGAFTCSGTPVNTIEPFYAPALLITVAVAPGAPSIRTASFTVQGGGAAQAANTVDSVTVTSEPPSFGFDAFDIVASTHGALDARAGAHIDQLDTTTNFATEHSSAPQIGDLWPVEDVRDVTVDLPPGLIGNPAAFPQCTNAQLIVGEGSPQPTCSTASQLGWANVNLGGAVLHGVPLFNLVPPPHAPARFAVNVLGTVLILDAHLRSSGDYGISVTSEGIPQAIAVDGNTVRFWGVPNGHAHDLQRSCPGDRTPEATEDFTPCPSGAEALAPFFRNPTSCGAAPPIAAHVDTWQHPDDVITTTATTHELPGAPYHPSEWGAPLSNEDCEAVPFEPTVDASLTTNHADAPTGLSVDIGLPAECWYAKETEQEALDSTCQSDMRESVVTLPQGVTINPSSANGLEACTPAEAGLITPVGSSPVHFNEAPVACPDASKVGTVEIDTPLLGKHDPKTGNPVTDLEGHVRPEPLTGSLYLAQQTQNPYGNVITLYLVAEGSGVIIKQAGKISLDPKTGQVVTTFPEVPQQPFSRIHFELFGGSRASLRTPAKCGTYTATASLTPWSGTPAAQRQSSLQISQGCGGGFNPHLRAGTANPLAADYSPFSVRLTREDASGALGGLDLRLPPGLLGRLAGIPYCPDSALAAISTGDASLSLGASEIAAPHCPAASRLGTVTVGAGAGTEPVYIQTGRAYLAGPYKGAPVSLAIVTPAVAGPLDLGNTLVRTALHIDPETVQIDAVSDPLPTILGGIPLDLRDLRVNLDRSGFILNPTSCDPLAIDATVAGAEGASAALSNLFQVGGCERLGFKPSLSFQLRGRTTHGGHPALRALVNYPTTGSYSNISSAAVTLPATELLENAHIKTVCTRVQYASGSGGGVGCPEGSIYGRARAWTPLLEEPLEGPVFLRSNPEHELPDLVASLRGQIQVDLAGTIDTVHGRIRNTFEAVPDTPVSKFELEMAGGKKSLLVNTSNLCKAKPHAKVAFTAHDNATRDTEPLVKTGCAKAKKKRGNKHRRHRG